MDIIQAGGQSFTVSRAKRGDVADLAALLADDILGGSREPGDLASYMAAFDEIDRDPNHYLAVVRNPTGVCGTLQLTTDKQRTDAHRSYDHLGYMASHDGYKLAL